MDWSSFIPYAVVLFNLGILSYQLGGLQARQRHLDGKVSYLVFIHAQLLEGKDPADILRDVMAVGREAKEAKEFAEIARRESRPWWRRVGRP